MSLLDYHKIFGLCKGFGMCMLLFLHHHPVVDMYTLQKLLTHKSPQITQRYPHLR